MDIMTWGIVIPSPSCYSWLFFETYLTGQHSVKCSVFLSYMFLSGTEVVALPLHAYRSSSTDYPQLVNSQSSVSSSCQRFFRTHLPRLEYHSRFACFESPRLLFLCVDAGGSCCSSRGSARRLRSAPRSALIRLVCLNRTPIRRRDFTVPTAFPPGPHSPKLKSNGYGVLGTPGKLGLVFVVRATFRANPRNILLG